MSEPITGPWPVDDATYFSSHEYVSASMLKVAARSLPEYHQRFVTRTMPSPRPSGEMQLGTLLHAALLEPERWEKRVINWKIDGRTEAGKERKKWEKLQAEVYPEKLFVTQEEEAAVLKMHAAVMAHDDASRFLRADTKREGPIRWRDESSGLWCKAKIDLLTCNGMVGDVKTCSDIAGFPWSAHRYAYHCQAAHYLAGAWAALDADGPMVFIVVASSAPFEVRTMIFGEEELQQGRRQNARLLAELAECHRTGNWASRFKGIEVLRFKHYQMED